MSSSYNEWESDLSSIIEKTNQNLKLLRRIGDKRVEGLPTQATITRPAMSTTSSASQIASDMRAFASSISNRYAAEDAGQSIHSSVPRPRTTVLGGGTSTGVSTTTARKLQRSTTTSRIPVPQSSVIYTTPSLDHPHKERSPRLKRTGSTSGTSKVTTGNPSTRAVVIPQPGQNDYSDSAMTSTIEGLRKSLEVHVASRASGYEKKLADLQTDVTVVTAETTALSQRFAELREAVLAKTATSYVPPSVVQSLQDSSEAISRLEKHSAVLLGWKVTMDQDLFELSAKCKPLGAMQEKTATLESQVEALTTAVKQRPARLEEKMEDLREQVRTLERQVAVAPDTKAIEHIVQTRVRMELSEFESRIQQQLLSLTQKFETKFQTLEKTTSTERNDAMTRLQSELMEMMDKMDMKTIKKQEWIPFQTAHLQLKEDIGQMHAVMDRQEQRLGEMKQASSFLRGEVNETKNELINALHAQQQRVITTLEEKTGQLTTLVKEKNEKHDQRIMALEKKNLKIDEQLKTLQTSLTTLKKEQSHQTAVTSVETQREHEQLKSKLVNAMVELEQLHTAKQALEKQVELQAQQHQQQRLALHKSLEEQERRAEKQRLEMIQTVEHDAKQLGALEGKAAVLESIVAHHKAEMEAKAVAARMSKNRSMVLKQKMKTMEKEAENKMSQLSTTLKAKQMECEGLIKQLQKKEIEARKAEETMQRETLALKKSKVWKEKELAMTMAKFEALQHARRVKRSIGEGHSQQQYEEEDVAELHEKQSELEQLLCEREAEMEEMQDELTRLHHEREQAQWRAQETLDQTVEHVSTKLASQLHVLEQEIAARDELITELRERVRVEVAEAQHDMSTNGVAAALAALKEEQEALQRQLETHQMVGKDDHAALFAAHTVEMSQLKATLRLSVEDMEAAHAAVMETHEVAARQSQALEKQQHNLATEFHGVTTALQTVRSEMEAMARAMHELERDKLAVGAELRNVQEQLSKMEQTSDKNRSALRELKTREQTLKQEKEQLQKELERQTDELIRAAETDASHRKTLADKLAQQERVETQLRAELEIEKESMETQIVASQAREGELNAALEVLRTELGVFQGQNKGMVAQVQDLMSSVHRVQAHETTLRERLSRALEAHHDADERTSWMHTALAEQTATLDELRRAHDAALMETTDTAARARILGQQVQTYKEQMKELRAETHALQLERDALQAQYMAAVEASALAATTVDELRHRVATLDADKETLEADLETIEKRRQAQQTAHANERMRLEGVNTALKQHIQAIRVKIASVEAIKSRELEAMRHELVELEATLNEAKELSSTQSDMTEKDWRTTQQSLVMVAQDVRSASDKLTSACSVEEWLKLRATLYNQEIAMDKTDKETERKLMDAQAAEDRVVRKVAALQVMGTTTSRDKEGLRMRYLADAPALMEQLQRMDASWKEALVMVSMAQQEHRHQQYEHQEDEEDESEVLAAEAARLEGEDDRDVTTLEIENKWVAGGEDDQLDADDDMEEDNFEASKAPLLSSPQRATPMLKTPFSRLLPSLSVQISTREVEEEENEQFDDQSDGEQEGKMYKDNLEASAETMSRMLNEGEDGDVDAPVEDREEEEKDEDEWDEGFRDSYLFEQPR